MAQVTQVNGMVKKDTNKGGKQASSTQNRESKILNIMVNTSLLLMTLMTDAFSDAFAGMAAGMMQAVTAVGEGAEKAPTTKETMERIKTEFPKQMRTQMLAMKTDMQKQLQAKKDDITGKIADPKFDAGITIAERYDIGIPPLTQDLDERSLLYYITLLKANDASCTKMFQELMEWMKTVNE
jgi:hypothetical protein